MALNPGIDRVRYVASAIISHERTQSNQVWCFQTLDDVFTKNFISDYLEIITAVVVPCGGPKKSPCHRYSVVIFKFTGPLGLQGSTLLHVFGNRVALSPRLGAVRDVAFAIIAHEQTLYKPNLLFSTLDAVFWKDLYFRLFWNFFVPYQHTLMETFPCSHT